MKRLVVATVLLAATPALARERPILHLGIEEPQKEELEKPVGSLLLRELIRQSVLIAARDGLGLPTRDEALREEALDGQRLDVTVQADARESLRFRLRRGSKAIFKHELPFAGPDARYDVVVKR